jgi:rRNA maturation protein Rpf1
MITTSRYASEDTRRMARKMAAGSGEPFVARGKRTVEQLVSLARRKGEDRITLIEEHEGRPAVTSVIAIDEMGRWRWSGEKAIKASA